MSIKYDSIEINDGTKYSVQKITHTSAPNKDVDYQDLTLRGGAKFIDSYYTTKEIIIEGTIEGTTAAYLQAYIDELKELFSRNGKYLDIENWNGETRRYKCVSVSTDLPMESFNITFIAYTATFLAYEGFARSTATTSEVLNNKTTATVSDTMTNIGTHEAYPTVTVSVDAENALTLIKFKTDATTDEISIAASYTAGDILIVNCENKTVTINGTEVAYTGNFPRFPSGAVVYTFTFTSTSHTVDTNITYTPLWL